MAILTLLIKIEVEEQELNFHEVNDIIVQVGKALHDSGLDCIGVREEKNEQLPKTI